MEHIRTDSSGGFQGFSLAAGLVLASRYRIVSFLGRGAVGEVYEAEDLELGDEIAVKVLRPEIARDERVLHRFKREIQLARRVTHPNVCRVFDLVYHFGEGGPGAPPERVFLTMELLRGETLEQTLARQGRMTTAEALPVIGHIAAALEAAHGNGVVHRDLKSGNVFLVPTASGTRAVVTDFGLAWSSIQEDSSASLTATGEMVGSPAYMAPEQVRGEEATPATDIYAFGVVMFEMITGELPFVGKSAFYTALKRLQEPAPSPRIHLSDLDPAWEKTILRCLEREPAARFKSVRHVVRSLGATKAEEDATSPLTLVGERRKRGLDPQLGLAVLLAVGLTGGLWLLQTRPFASRGPAGAPAPPAAPTRTAAAPVALRPSVAVLPFDDLSDSREDPNDLVFFELLPVELAATGKLRVIPPEEIDSALRDLRSSASARPVENVLPGLWERLGADFFVTGAALRDRRSGRVRYDVLVRDGRTRQTVDAFSESGAEALEALGGRLRARLGAGELTPAEAEALRSLRPKTEAAALYAGACRDLRRAAAPAALAALKKAVAIDPDSPLLRSALLRAWWDMGYRQEAQDEAKQAFQSASTLRPEDRLALQAQYHETTGQWDEAAASYQEIAQTFPDDLEIGLRLAAAQAAADHAVEAEETLARLRLLPPPMGNDPRIFLGEAVAAAARPDYERQKEAAGRAFRRASKLGARLLAARARLQEGQALQSLKDLAGAARVFAEAKRTFSAEGDLRGVAEADRLLAAVRNQQGDAEGMRAAYGEAVDIYLRIGAEGDAAQALNRAGNLHYHAGDLARAEGFYRRALPLIRKVGYRKGEASILHNLAAVTFQRGRRAEAKELFRQNLARHTELDNPEGQGASLHGLGTIAVAEGDLLEARRLYQQALSAYDRSGSEAKLPELFNDLAETSFALGELPRSRQEREKARDFARRTGDDEEGARAVAGLAAVARQQGDPAAARPLQEQALALFHTLKLPVREAALEDEIGVTLTLQGELMEALKRFQQSLAIVRQENERRTEAAVLAHQGRALLRFGEIEPALAAQRRSLAIGRDLDESALEAAALTGLGEAQRVQGDLGAARRSLEEALAIFRRRGERSGVASALYSLGEVALAGGDPARARERHGEALVIRTDVGERLAAAESRLAIAGLALAVGNGAQAEAAALKELVVFRELRNPPGEAAATLLLARCLLAQGKTAAARGVLQDAARLLDASQEPAVRKAAAELRARAAG